MIKIAFHNNYLELNRDNFLFENPKSLLSDDLYAPFHTLKLAAKEQGMSCGTSSAYDLNEVDLFVFMDVPKSGDSVFRFAKQSGKKMILLILESKLIHPENWNLDRHECFDRIFTWDSDLVDNSKYFHFFVPHHFPSTILKHNFNDKKFATLIASKKMVHASGELYSKRVDIIRWFEENAPSLFDLFGHGWDKNYFSGLLYPLNIFRKLSIPLPLLQRSFSSYRGSVDQKREVLKQYKFNLCFENFTGVKGYITEKIFDSFFSGTVPVYEGADDVLEFIPKECFIDMRLFDSFESLYSYLSEMSEEDYKQRLSAIGDFIFSQKGKVFTDEYFSNLLVTSFKQLI